MEPRAPGCCNHWTCMPPCGRSAAINPAAAIIGLACRIAVALATVSELVLTPEPASTPIGPIGTLYSGHGHGCHDWDLTRHQGEGRMSCYTQARVQTELAPLPTCTDFYALPRAG